MDADQVGPDQRWSGLYSPRPLVVGGGIIATSAFSLKAVASQINACLELSCQVFFTGSGVVFFEGIAYKLAHVTSKIAVDETDEWRGHDQDQTLITVGFASFLQFTG